MKIPETIFLEETESTNADLAERLRQKNLPEFSTITSLWQKAGRGQGSNKWFSSRGKNLLSSILIYPYYIEAKDQFSITQAVSLSICDVLSEIMPEENIQIKWPNDIYVNQKKIAGILIENQIKGNQIAASIIGIGLNVNESDFPENLSMAVSMIKYTKRIINPSELLPKICSKLETNLEWIKKNGPNHFLKAYLGKMYRFDTLSDYIYEGKRIRACIIGIDEYGRLLLKKQNTIITCDVREISFV